MKKKKVYILVAIIIIIAIAATFYSSRRWRAKEDPPRILVSGNIEATEVKVSFKIPGRILKRLVDEGTIVKEGDLISRLEDRELIDQKEKAEAALEALQANVPKLLTTIEKEERTSTDEINQAEASLQSAHDRLAKLLHGYRPQEIEQSRVEVERTKSELEKAEKFYARSKQLVQGGYVAVKDFDTTKESYEVAFAMHKKSLENYSLVKEGFRKEEIQEARSEVEKAKASLSLAHSKRLQVKVYQHDLEVTKARIKEAKAALEVARRQVEYSEVSSPISGVVLVKSAEEGEYVSPGATIVTIADLDHVWLKAYVDETDLGRVKLGQNVQIRTDTFPRKTYGGRISFISSEAEFTPKQVQTQKERVKLVYRIKIEVENRDRELKPGMPADGEILIEE